MSIHYLGLTNSFDQVPRDIHTLDKFLEIFNHTQSIFEEHFNWNNSKELLKKYFIQKKIFQDNYIISFSNKVNNIFNFKSQQNLFFILKYIQHQFN